MDWAVVIVGAGPAGLSATLVLGRACRRVLLCDTGTPRSWASKSMHAYLSLDGIPPTRFLDISRREVLAYPGVRFRPVEVTRARRIARLEGRRGRLRAILFSDGTQLPRDALFFDTPSRSQSRLAESLGCCFTRDGGVSCGEYEATSVPGVFVAGNIIRDVQLSIVAAAEGARAAFGINRALTRENFERRARSGR